VIYRAPTGPGLEKGNASFTSELAEAGGVADDSFTQETTPSVEVSFVNVSCL
jgi:hypothetical protein